MKRRSDSRFSEDQLRQSTRSFERLYHPLRPIFDAHSRVLILGTFPSPKSREISFYYGHPQNRFWKVMAALFDELLPQSNESRTQLLLRHSIALWDVVASCEIQGASDASIRNPLPNDLFPIFAAADIRAIFTTGVKATQLYRKLTEPVIQRPCISLPSTSPANASQSLNDLIDAYQVILPYIAAE